MSTRVKFDYVHMSARYIKCVVHMGWIGGLILGGVITWWVYYRQKKISSQQDDLLDKVKEFLEFETPIVAIKAKFEKLTTVLLTAISDDLGKLDKEATSYDNVLDAFRLSLQMFKLKEKESDTILYATVE